MKDTLFSNAFHFNHFSFNKYKYTDNRCGCLHYYLALMIKGRCRIVSKLGEIACNEGDVFFIPKNLSYESYWYGDDEIEFLSFGFSGLGTDDDLNYRLQVLPRNGYLRELVSEVSTEEHSPSCSTLSKFYGVMGEVLPILERSESGDEYIAKRAERYMRDNTDCTVADIAAACNVCPSYLYRIFNRHLKITPNELRSQILAKKGIELLRTTDRTVEEISGMLGFSSASYFRRVIRKHTGSTPRQIRKESVL